MNLIADRKGNISEENSLQDCLLEKLYGNAAGRLLLKPLVSPLFSRAGGAFLDSGLSRFLIRHFICSHAIDMWDYQPREYASFNDFFTRRLAEGARKVDFTPEVLVSPCDGRLSVHEINDSCVFSVKHTPYTLESLLKDRKLAAEYAGGYVWLFRLCVDDYHRYIYADGGDILKFMKIPGVLHTVNPVANEQFSVYKENTREYCILKSDNFDTDGSRRNDGGKDCQPSQRKHCAQGLGERAICFRRLHGNPGYPERRGMSGCGYSAEFRTGD